MPDPLSAEVVEARLAGTRWTREGDAIVAESQVKDFAAALAYANEVGELAEAVNHHPDILIHGWNRVRLSLSTHSVGGITEADFALAERIDGLPGSA
jgi:4a-hydroxytetrahydrobiopterin dehydratase